MCRGWAAETQPPLCVTSRQMPRPGHRPNHTLTSSILQKYRNTSSFLLSCTLKILLSVFFLHLQNTRWEAKEMKLAYKVLINWSLIHLLTCFSGMKRPTKYSWTNQANSSWALNYRFYTWLGMHWSDPGIGYHFWLAKKVRYLCEPLGKSIQISSMLFDITNIRGSIHFCKTELKLHGRCKLQLHQQLGGISCVFTYNSEDNLKYRLF